MCQLFIRNVDKKVTLPSFWSIIRSIKLYSVTNLVFIYVFAIVSLMNGPSPSDSLSLWFYLIHAFCTQKHLLKQLTCLFTRSKWITWKGNFHTHIISTVVSKSLWYLVSKDTVLHTPPLLCVDVLDLFIYMYCEKKCFWFEKNLGLAILVWTCLRIFPQLPYGFT